MKTLLSGIRISGNLHIGNYFGAIKQWIDLQDEYQVYAFLADLHGLTTLEEGEKIGQKTLEVAKLYIALGLDPKKCILFVQSHVPEHTELSWILSSFAYMGELSRMTQFKEKSEGKENINLGLFSYPVLMASDILLYKPEVVPVGDDQKQHIELTRDLAQRFNNRFGEVFTIPKDKILDSPVARIKSLTDPNNKMSKSGNPNNAIFLLDDEKTITEKIKIAVTDSGSEIKFDLSEKPAVSNLITLYSLLTKKSSGEIEEEFSNLGYGELKTRLASELIEFLTPIQTKYNEISDAEILEILNDGSKKASEVAKKTLKEVVEKTGLLSKS